MSTLQKLFCLEESGMYCMVHGVDISHESSVVCYLKINGVILVHGVA